MAEAPQVKKGAADVMTPQLPQGEATKLNTEQDALLQQGQPEAEPGATPLQPNAPAPLEKDPTSQFLHGPTQRPGEPLSQGVGADGKPQIPAGHAAAWLGALSVLASDPTAPPAVKAIMALLAQTARGN